MLPVNLVVLKEFAGHAAGCIAQVLATVPAAERELLLEALNALDDIEAMVGTAFDLSAEPVDDAEDEAVMPRLVPLDGVALVA